MRIDIQHPQYSYLCDLATKMQYTLEDVTGQDWSVEVSSLQHFDVQFKFECGLFRCMTGCLDVEATIDRPRQLQHTLMLFWGYQLDPALQAVIADIRSRSEAT